MISDKKPPFFLGIGERSPLKRSLIVDLLKPFGFKLNSESNEKNQTIISDDCSSASPKVFVIPTNEELVIAQETISLID